MVQVGRRGASASAGPLFSANINHHNLRAEGTDLSHGQQVPRAQSPPKRDWEPDRVPFDCGDTIVKTHRIIPLEPFPLPSW